MSKCVFSVFLLEQTDVMASLGQFLPLVKHACGLTAAACYSISMSMTIRDFASSRQILYKFMSLIKSGHQIAICTVDLELFLTPECPSWPLFDHVPVALTLLFRLCICSSLISGHWQIFRVCILRAHVCRLIFRPWSPFCFPFCGSTVISSAFSRRSNRTHPAQVDSECVWSGICTVTLWHPPPPERLRVSPVLKFTRQRCPVVLASLKNMWCRLWKQIFHSRQECSSDSILFYLSTCDYTEQNKEIKAESFECLSDLFSILFWHNLSFFLSFHSWVWCLPLSDQCLLMFTKSQFKTMN